ncbi:MAG: hypothetical protein A2603_16965 [Bdellovibrionales bacterium RIFOXYD1_FULL_55_31]|nr:MAG: hypothetical protein A2603_16965 [Bdellovibrionales bacterium RIFOXYD1_FULL_55_31]
MSNKRLRAVFLVSLLVLAVFASMVVLFSSMEEDTESLPRIHPRSVATEEVTGEVKRQAAVRVTHVTDATGSAPELWKNFEASFGTGFEPQWREGLLASIRATNGKLRNPNARAAQSGFESQDSEQVLARARELLAALELLVGVEAELPLEGPVVRVGDISAHIFFQETWRGIPIEPLGKVSIDLGSNGELRGFDSTYVRGLRIKNQVGFSMEEGRIKALSWFYRSQPEKQGVQVAGGKQIIWVSGQNGWHAYEYFVRGYQIVIDAMTGELLYGRSARSA